MTDPTAPALPAAVLPATVRTARLALPLFTADEVGDVRAGRRRATWHPDFPREDDVDGVGMWRDGDTWASRVVVLDGRAVGSIGFFGPPEPAADGVPEAEVGYGLVEEVRGRGLMTEALAALLEQTDAVGVRVRASFRAENTASMRVLTTCGFTDVRGSTAEGELVMARPVRG